MYGESDDVREEALSDDGVVGTTKRKKTSLVQWLFGFVLLSLVVGGGVLLYMRIMDSPPSDFPTGVPITIEQGAGVRSITEYLATIRVVRSADFLYYTLVLQYDPTNIKASTYVFDEPMTTREIAKRLTEGDFDTDLVRLTHIEGERVARLATQAAQTLPAFNEANFVALATPYEGKLYPETYFIPASFDETDLLELLLTTFEQETALVFATASSSLPQDEVLVLASVIEREANSIESMKMVSGILQNRLDIGMPLQADASIEYVLDKPLAELTPEDLEIDSPYNTYLNTGLPPTPIGNPGLDAIRAVLEPTASDYFYYITDEAGEFHYAKTYEEHMLNIERYFR